MRKTNKVESNKDAKKNHQKMSDKILRFYDNTYVNLDLAETPGNKFYYSYTPKDIVYNQKVNLGSKFPKKNSDFTSHGQFWHRFCTLPCELYNPLKNKKNVIFKNQLLP